MGWAECDLTNPMRGIAASVATRRRVGTARQGTIIGHGELGGEVRRGASACVDRVGRECMGRQTQPVLHDSGNRQETAAHEAEQLGHFDRTTVRSYEHHRARERERGSQRRGEGRCAVLLLRLVDGPRPIKAMRAWGKRDKPRRASTLGWLAGPDGPCRHTLKQAGWAAGCGSWTRAKADKKQGREKKRKGNLFPISEMRF